MIEGIERVGVLAAQLMERIEADEDPEVEVSVGEVMLLVEIRAEDEEGRFTYIEWRCSDERQWVQRGMLHAGLEQERTVVDSDDEEDGEG